MFPSGQGEGDFDGPIGGGDVAPTSVSGGGVPVDGGDVPPTSVSGGEGPIGGGDTPGTAATVDTPVDGGDPVPVPNQEFVIITVDDVNVAVATTSMLIVLD